MTRFVPSPPDSQLAPSAVRLAIPLGLLACVLATTVFAQSPAPPTSPSPPEATGEAVTSSPDSSTPSSDNTMTLRQLLRAGGSIGLVILGLSMAMVALVVEHLLTIRRQALMPKGLSDQVASLLAAGRFTDADKLCRERPSFLGAVLAEGLADAPLGYVAVEKSMEDACAEQAARLFRKIEYLSVIGTLAPMLGLLGTVWGMIVAFQEFATKINPPVSELAPGIYQALVTTLMGLGVAVPALAAFAIFRNRIDELVAEASLAAEHTWAGFKRAGLGRTNEPRRRRGAGPESSTSGQGSRRVPPVAIERPEDPSP